ncbi:protein of unassigned function [Methylobacterium oryzae CBMB20]|uniref:Protein of unassigned function n=1 Tax=Methylobacterium oryzae CBMB20 TaxID=693986 RepID=A0A089NN72_9HYPH|nr:protein of unassigned function [Methylobacterium oryzae CBMB20]
MRRNELYLKQFGQTTLQNETFGLARGSDQPDFERRRQCRG